MLTIDMSQAFAVMDRNLANMAKRDVFLDAVGDMVSQRVKDRIEGGKTSPDGSPWAPWAPYTAAKRAAKGNADRGLLFDSGYLLRSITSETMISGVTIWTPASYASDLQNGDGGRLPARPFMGWSREEIAEVYSMATLWINGA